MPRLALAAVAAVVTDMAAAKGAAAAPPPDVGTSLSAPASSPPRRSSAGVIGPPFRETDAPGVAPAAAAAASAADGPGRRGGPEAPPRGVMRRPERGDTAGMAGGQGCQPRAAVSRCPRIEGGNDAPAAGTSCERGGCPAAGAAETGNGGCAPDVTIAGEADASESNSQLFGPPLSTLHSCGAQALWQEPISTATATAGRQRSPFGSDNT